MRPALLALAALTLSSASAYAQKNNGSIEVGDWTISDTHKPDGAFESCTASFTFDDNSVVAFIVAADKTTAIIVREPKAHLLKDKTYPLRVQIDSGKAVLGEGVALTSQALLVPIEKPDTMFAELAAGDTLFIEVNDRKLEEPLVGSGAALKALGACASRSLGD